MSKEKRQVYEFDNFRLDPGERQLLRDGEPVMLPSKAFDLLVVLVENTDGWSKRKTCTTECGLTRSSRSRT